MTEIRFTLGDSDVWHIIRLKYELTKEVFRDEHDLSYIVKREQDRAKCFRAKKVEVLDEYGNLLARSSNILDWNKLEYITNQENDESK